MAAQSAHSAKCRGLASLVPHLAENRQIKKRFSAAHAASMESRRKIKSPARVHYFRRHKPFTLDAMKTPKVICLLALCLTLSEGCSQGEQDRIVLANTLAASEENAIKVGLAKMGIGEGYEITVADQCADVENTAAQEMQQFLARGSLSARIVPESQTTAEKRIILGRASSLGTIRNLENKGEVTIRSVAAEDDGFHLKQTGSDIVVAGANPRGVLYGVYAFEDFIMRGPDGPLEIKRIPRFESRYISLPVFLTTDHPASYREFSEETAAYYARLGVNGCVDGGGGSWELSRFVSSDIFPFQKPPDRDLQRRISTTSSLLKKYGIDYYIMLWEPALARVDADIGKYPTAALGTVKRPWGGDKNGMDTTLCVTSSVVQEHYRNMIKKFVRQYPDVKGFLFYNLDGDSWLCTPQLCPRCKTICPDSPPDTPHPWETQALFTDLLAKASREERSDFQFIHWISHFHAQAAEKLVRRAQEYSALAYGVQNGDHDLMISDPIDPTGSEFLILQKVCAERSVPFFVTYSANTHEVIPNGFPFPFHIAAAVRKLNGWGVRHDIGSGPIPYFNQVNALVEREFLWNPDQDPDTFLADLSVRQFGERAGKLMFGAWEEIRDGMNVWRDVRLHPFCGSQTLVSLGFSYFTNARAILPDIVEYYDHSLQTLTNVEPFRAPDYQRFREKEFLRRFELMGTHLAKAAALAKQVTAKTEPDEPIGICYFRGDSVPTRKEYAELNYAPIAIADVYCQLRCNMLRAYHLLTDIKTADAAGDGKTKKEDQRQYYELISKDIAVRKSFIRLLTEFSEMRPCLTRTSLSEQGIAHQISYMNGEIEKMENFRRGNLN